MKAFLTGSRVYGTPRDDSDVDMVVMVDIGDQSQLHELSDGDAESGGVRFGRLNIIMVPNKDVYDKWRLARSRCLLEHPVTRDRAIQIHRECGA